MPTYDYTCSVCSVSGVKLWSYYNDYTKDDTRTNKLYCARHVLQGLTEHNEDTRLRSLPDKDGRWLDSRYGLVDSPTYYFPAVVCVSDVLATTLFYPRLCLAPDVDVTVWRNLSSYLVEQEVIQPKFNLLNWLCAKLDFFNR